ncbi:MAG: hypothetical protein AAGU05_08590 [Anaerolineaceae bacterium]
MNQPQSTSDQPDYHVKNVRNMMQDLVNHIEQDQQILEEQRVLALFETTREVLLGLITAFNHYEEKSEKAWRD